MFEFDPYYIEARVAEIRHDAITANLGSIVREVIAENPRGRARSRDRLHARFIAYRAQA
jgi:hypothetical protein